MTWLGKILAVLVLVMTLAWMWFTVQVFVTRTNWRAEAMRYQKGYNEAIAAREAEYKVAQSKVDALAQSMVSLQEELKAARAQEENLKADLAKNKTDIESLLTTSKNKAMAAVTQHQANEARLQEEAKVLRELNKKNEDQIVALVVTRDRALADRQQADIERRGQEQRASQFAKLNEDLTNLVQELEANGGRRAGVSKSPPAVPTNLRGTVTQVAGDLVTLSVGADSDLREGTELDLYRLDSTPSQYLGKVRVLQVAPKTSVGRFLLPASVTRPKPENMPRVGDEVGRLGR